MHLRQKYICSSESCRCEIELEIPPDSFGRETPNPTCGCGAKMKKVYKSPVLFRLYRAEVNRDTSQCQGSGTFDRNLK